MALLSWTIECTLTSFSEQTWGSEGQDKRQGGHLDGHQHIGRMGWHNLKAWKGWSQALHSGKDSPMAQHGLDASWLSRKTPMALLNRLAVSQMCAPKEMKANYTPGCTGKIKPADQGKGLFPLLSAPEAAPETVCKRQILTSKLAQAQKRDSQAVRGLEHTTYKNPCRNWVSPVWRR